MLVGDVIYDIDAGFSGAELHDIEDPTRGPVVAHFDDARDVLVTYLDGGRAVRAPDDLATARARVPPRSSRSCRRATAASWNSAAIRRRARPPRPRAASRR